MVKAKSFNNDYRRNQIANRRYFHVFEIMRFCQFCLSHDVICRVNREHLKCESCYRNNRKYDLIFDYHEMNKIIKKIDRLNDEILKTRFKLVKLKKQRKYWLSRLRDLSDAKSRNILKIEKKQSINETSIIISFSKEIFVDFVLLKMFLEIIDEFLRDFSLLNDIVETFIDNF